MSKIEVGYGNDKIEFSIPKDYNYTILGSNLNKIDIPEEVIIENALDNPIGTSRLEDIVNMEDKICIVISDITRAWQRMKVYLPHIVKRLSKLGIKDENIVFLCATGSHRSQSSEEHKMLVGNELYERHLVIDHNCKDEDNLVYFGTTSFGTPVSINKIAAACDHIILTGAIAFHDLAGWSGGKKSILPGIAGYESIMKNHSLSLNSSIGEGIHPEVRSGNILNNPIHEDMTEAVKMVNPSFMFNVIIGESGKICDAVAGHYLDAHSTGREKVNSLNSIEIDKKAELVIVSAGGYPKDIDLYQATKALINAKDATIKGGNIILIAQCNEGIGHEEMEDIIINYDDNLEREKSVRDKYTVSKFIGYLTAEIAKDYNIYMISDLPINILERINIKPVKNTEEALDIISDNQNEINHIYVIPKGSDVLPDCTNKKT